MRSIRRYPQTRVEADGLFPELVDVLLIGWAAANHPESGDPFKVFDCNLCHVWAAHENRLRREARHRGIEPSWPVGGQLDFYGACLVEQVRGAGTELSTKGIR